MIGVGHLEAASLRRLFPFSQAVPYQYIIVFASSPNLFIAPCTFFTLRVVLSTAEMCYVYIPSIWCGTIRSLKLFAVALTLHPPPCFCSMYSLAILREMELGLLTIFSIYYQYIILLLFRPFINLRLAGSSVLPREVCLQAAENISALIRSHNQIYQRANHSAFFPYILLSSAMMHLVRADTIPPSVNDSTPILLDIVTLQDLSRNPFAGRAIMSLMHIAEQWDVAFSFDTGLEKNNGLEKKNGLEKNKGLLNYGWQPVPGSMNFFCLIVNPALSVKILHHTKSAVFAPFPMQGLPSITMESLVM